MDSYSTSDSDRHEEEQQSWVHDGSSCSPSTRSISITGPEHSEKRIGISYLGDQGVVPRVQTYTVHNCGLSPDRKTIFPPLLSDPGTLSEWSPSPGRLGVDPLPPHGGNTTGGASIQEQMQEQMERRSGDAFKERTCARRGAARVAPSIPSEKVFGVGLEGPNTF